VSIPTLARLKADVIVTGGAESEVAPENGIGSFAWLVRAP